MARPKKPKPRLPTLEEQLAEHMRDTPPETGGDAYEQAYRRAWVKKRNELQDAIRHRDARPFRETGRDASGNFGVSPYAARDHEVEKAPKSLGKEIPADGSFPKRATTQRMFDRYKARSQITLEQWKAANMLWEHWNALGLEQRLAAGYDPVMVQTSPSKDGLIAKKVDATAWWVEAMAAVPYHSRGVVRAVVVEDRSAGDWARERGYSRDDSGRIGMGRLRAGLSALVDHLRC